MKLEALDSYKLLRYTPLLLRICISQITQSQQTTFICEYENIAQDDMNLGENKRIPIRKLDDLTRKRMLATHFKRIEETQVAAHGGEVLYIFPFY